MLPFVTLLSFLAVAAEPVQADYIIRGASLYDGSGAAGRAGDVAIKGDRIVAIGPFEVRGNPIILEAEGLIVAPGFIDLHTHSDEPILAAATRANLSYLTQGVTTIVTGNCGAGPVDVARFYRALDQGKAGTNVAHQIPHNALRQQVMGNVNRQPSKDELEKMKSLVAQGMKDGAWSLSTGLIYTPGSYSGTEELVELAKVAAAHGGFYASHIRGEGTELLSAINEALEIGRRARIPVHISHFKASGPKAWNKMADAIALVEQARANGQAVTADQYPYTASSTSLSATLIPARYREGTQNEFVARLDDPDWGPRIRLAISEGLKEREGGKTVQIARCKAHPSWQGKDLAAIAANAQKTALDVVLDMERSGGASVVIFGMSEENVRLVMKLPFVATASDGSSKIPDDSVPHPRSYGTFPRKIGLYALAEKALPLERAIRSASGLPADILRLPERGYLKPGYLADIVVFDPKTYRDLATFDKPHQFSTGVRYLFVNGVLTIDNGKYTEALAGRALRHQDDGMR
jgi:N-acyl-D-aspartate/D-glutamate deacylase